MYGAFKLSLDLFQKVFAVSDGALTWVFSHAPSSGRVCTGSVNVLKQYRPEIVAISERDTHFIWITIHRSPQFDETDEDLGFLPGAYGTCGSLLAKCGVGDIRRLWGDVSNKYEQLCVQAEYRFLRPFCC